MFIMKNDTVQSGAHLGTMRSWIQRNAGNGETVTWGSQEFVALKPLTAHDLDRLAQDIKDAVVEEQKGTIQNIIRYLKVAKDAKEDLCEFNIMRCIQDLESLLGENTK